MTFLSTDLKRGQRGLVVGVNLQNMPTTRQHPKRKSDEFRLIVKGLLDVLVVQVNGDSQRVSLFS